MCNYLSFCGDLNGEQFWFEPMLSSHSATAELHSLKPDTCREYEWTTDDESGLIVRTHPDDPHDAAWLRACVLAKWPTRKALEEWLIVNVPQSQIQGRVAKSGDRSSLSAGDRSSLSAGDHSALTAGDNSTLTAGDNSTLAAGDNSTLAAGNRSTLTAGYGSTLAAGNDSILVFWEYRKGQSYRHIGVVGQNDIKPNVPYCIVDGKLTEVPQPKEAGK